MLNSLVNLTEDVLNSHGRSARHVATGAALVTGAVAISALIAARNAPTPDHPKIKHAYDQLKTPAIQPPRKTFGIVWPPLFVLLTLSGLRVWNAPESPQRTRALGLWGGVQVLNALWMALGPKRLPAQTATAIATLGCASAYSHEAGKVDRTSADLVSPYVGWIAFANVLTGEFLRLNRHRFAPAYSVH